MLFETSSGLSDDLMVMPSSVIEMPGCAWQPTRKTAISARRHIKKMILFFFLDINPYTSLSYLFSRSCQSLWIFFFIALFPDVFGSVSPRVFFICVFSSLLLIYLFSTRRK